MGTPDGTDSDPGPPLSPGEQPAGWRAPLVLRRQLRLAAGVWLLLGLLLWLLPALTGPGPTPPLAWLRRMAQLAGPCLSFLLLPAAVLPALAALARRPWRFALELGLGLGALALAALGALWCALALLAAFDLEDPWERMPFVFPPYLEDFRARHPHLQLITLNRVRTVRLWAGGERLFTVEGPEIADAQVRIDACAAPPTSADLGGLTLPPEARCQSRVSVRRAGTERITWQFAWAALGSTSAWRGHFEDWARAQGAELQVSGGPSYQVQAQRGERRWAFEVRRERQEPLRLVVPQGGLARPWPDRQRGQDADRGDPP
jgi:hypothetical protein